MPLPQPLISGLIRRGAVVTLVTDAPAAMAELAVRDYPVLIVADPTKQRQYGELLGSIRRYYPQVRCWQYSGSAQANDQGCLTLINAEAGVGPLPPSPQAVACSSRESPGDVSPAASQVSQQPVDSSVKSPVAVPWAASVAPTAGSARANGESSDNAAGVPLREPAAGDGQPVAYAGRARPDERWKQQLLVKLHAAGGRDHESEQPDDHTPLISEEELTMLLGPLPDGK